MFVQSKLAMLHCEKLNSMSPGPMFVGTEPACAEFRACGFQGLG